MTAGFTEPLTKQVALTGVETDLGSLFGESTGKVRLSIPDAATSSVWLGKKGVTTDDDEYKKGTQTQLPTTSLRGWYAVTDGASVTITITIATGGVDAPDWITAGTNGASSGGGGGGGTVDQGAGDAANPWFVQGVNGGVPERLATQADQTNGEQKTRITDGTNDAVVMNSAPTGTEYGIGTRAIGTTATTNSINSQVDGHSETIGATTDADTGSTVVALLKRLKGLFAGGLPSALIADRLPVIIGSWLGSTAPTVGAKTKASSIPVAIATETIGTAGTPSADVFSMQGVPSGTPMPASNAVASQADGHSATLGTTADATTATTVIGRLQKLVSLLPAALGLGGGLKSEGVGVAGTPAGGVASVQGVSGGTAIPVSGTVAATQSGTWSTGVANWIGSTSPTVGQKTGANSIPVVLASDTAAFTFQPSSSPNVANYLPVRVNVDGANYWSVMANSAGVNAPGNSPVIWSMMRGRTYSAAATPGLVYDIQVDTTGRVAVFGNRVARTAHLNSATLPAAGAYTSQTVYTVPEGVIGVTMYVTYTRGAAGGQVKLRPEYGNGTETARGVATTATAVSGDTVEESLAFHDFAAPVTADANPQVFAIEIDVPPGCTTLRLLAAEKGVTGTPGTCAITLTAKYGSA